MSWLSGYFLSYLKTEKINVPQTENNKKIFIITQKELDDKIKTLKKVKMNKREFEKSPLLIAIELKCKNMNLSTVKDTNNINDINNKVEIDFEII
jgi:hypothetical protein